MKKQFFLFSIILCSLFLMTSCGGGSADSSNDESSTKTTSKKKKGKFKQAQEDFGNFSRMAKEAQKTGEEVQKLAELDPLTSEDFKSWMPDKIGDLKRTGYKNNNVGGMNIATSEATYKNEDGTKSIRIEIIDGAGSGSFAIAGMRMIEQINVDEEDENGYKKTVKWNGTKVKEEHRYKGERSTLTFLYDDRFAVTVNSAGMPAEKALDLLEEMNFKKLSKKAS